LPRTAKPTNSSNILKIAIVLLAIAAIIFLLIFVFTNQDSYIEQAEFTAVGANVTYAHNTATLHATGNNFFLFDGRSVDIYTATGDIALSIPINMGAPWFSGNGRYAVALEQGGHTAYVLNETGKAYTATVNYPISGYALGSCGRLIIITAHNVYNIYEHTLFLFSPRGEQVLTINLTHAQRHPIAAAISTDGRHMAVSFIDTSGLELNSIVFFYSIDGNAATIIASNSNNPNQIVGIIRFMNNNLITISDKEVRAYSTYGTMLAHTPVYNRVTYVAFTNNFLALSLGAGILNMPSKPPNTTIFFNSNLIPISSFESNSTITRITAIHDAALITTGRELTAVTSNGNILWRRIITHDITHAAFLTSTNKIILAGPTMAQVFTITP